MSAIDTALNIAPQTDTAKEPVSVERAILLVVAVFLGVVALATYIWGLPALAMIALAFVPVMFVILLLITVGK